MTDFFTSRLGVSSVRLDLTSPDGGGSLLEAAREPLVSVGVPVVEGEDGPSAVPGMPETVPASGQPSAPRPDLCARQGFSGKAGETMLLLASEGRPATVYLGCGRAGGVTTGDLRRAAAAFIRASGRSGTAAMLLPKTFCEQVSETRSSGPRFSGARGEDPGAEGPGAEGPGAERDQTDLRRAVQVVVEGAVLAAYRFSSHKSDRSSRRVERFVVAGIDLDEDALSEGVARGARISSAVCDARDLVNEPPSSMTPRLLADAAGSLNVDSASAGVGSAITVEVWDEDRIEAEKLGGLLGVARGSAEPPRLIRMDYEPSDPIAAEGRVPHVVLVGKGITFDSGGLSLKTPDGMSTMKTDMSGAATVLASLSACADLGIRVRVTAIAPVTENMPGGRASKPGDVFKARDGQTIEVLNTDAEGRLVLADALSIAAEMKPDAIIDLATLTGAAVVALGGRVAAVFGNDQALVDEVCDASARAGEPLWQLPLASEYKSHIESEVADMKNIGKAGQAGSIVAALLLENFVDGVPWVHIDMAGPARSDEEDGVLTKGATGFGVRTLIEFLDRFGAPRS